jgi:hypothetical protein
VHEIPPREAVRVTPLSEQFPEVRDQDNAPLDCPPVAVRRRLDPVVKELALVTVSPDCEAREIVIVVFADTVWL